MGHKWSMLQPGHLEESEFEEGDSMSFSNSEPSKATTEASSSVPVFDRGLCPACPNDIEIDDDDDDDALVVAFLDRLLKFRIVLDYNLSNLQSADALGKKEKAKPGAVSTSNFSSVKGSLKDSEIVQVSPSVATCRLRPRKSETYREANFRGKLGTCSGSAIQPRHNQLMDVASTLKGEGKLQALRYSSAPTASVLLFQLDRKRKRSSGLPSLAFDCTSHVKLKARTPLERPSKGSVREAVLDLGTGDAMVGRSVRKESCKGRISRYNAARRLYQIKYENGKEEALEWLDLEPCLMAAIGHETNRTVAESARTRPRYKTVDEIYTKHKKISRPAGRR